MADIYDYPTVNQTSSFNGIAEYVNQVTNNLFFPLILLAMFVITFVTTMHLGTGRAFVFASFFCSIIAIFLVIGGLLGSGYMYLLFVMLGIGLMLLRLGKSSPLPQI
ncbi:MAG: hypothetical protein WD512_13230 [Candidatus Paceibacterota bacterium]